ncbi:MAG: hypothetical protein K2O73_07380 [Lachnospiraceae bacterium]|nr:hypothetical protein [Lachnospiraceae bacterium]MDE7436698.1 hypothetical protein [Lachnospiraceae bacterium]
MLRDSWDHFTSTGSVHDYLEYKREEHSGKTREEARREQCREQERDGYGYGAYRDADR